MTHSDFNHLLSSIKGLSPEQSPPAARPPARPAGEARASAATKTAKRVKAATPPEKTLTPAEIDQYMLSIGLLSQLPDTAADYDDPDDEPITIKGEPLSETIIRERRGTVAVADEDNMPLNKPNR